MYCLGNKFPGSSFKNFATVHFFVKRHFGVDYKVSTYSYGFAKIISVTS